MKKRSDSTEVDEELDIFNNNKIVTINLSLYSKVTLKEIKEVVKYPKMNRAYYVLEMNRLNILDVAVAKELAMHSKFLEIQLNGLHNIEDKALIYLVKCHAALELGIKSLSPKQAQILVEHKAALTLNGLKKISNTSARILSNYKGNILDLPALTSTSSKAFGYLNEFKNDFLTIGGLQQKAIYNK